MPSDPKAKPISAKSRSPLRLLDALIGAPDDVDGPDLAGTGEAPRHAKGRSALLAHATAQRENRMKAEKRAAADKLNARADAPEGPPDGLPDRGDRPVQQPAEAKPAPRAAPRRRPAIVDDREPRRPPPPSAGLDDVIVKALGTSARGHLKGGALDRESALTDLIARTQSRLAGGGPPVADPAPAGTIEAPSAPTPASGREAMIAAAMRTHRQQQAIFDGLSLRERATLQATAEVLVAGGQKAGD